MRVVVEEIAPLARVWVWFAGGPILVVGVRFTLGMRHCVPKYPQILPAIRSVRLSSPVEEVLDPLAPAGTLAREWTG
ncbi:hypothetical protein GCM10009617_00490 [Leifsonia poae]|uniref:Uncharacterized protein n=1 Tax=Leifsonia poae TaxID=110933 RepID=A0A9W6LY57_9MICO|nr:hypothetical protein GCM10017584_00490 [Leifsonia poae]